MMDERDEQVEEQEQIVVREKKGPARFGIWLLIPLAAGLIVLCTFAQQWKDSLTVQAVVVAGHKLLGEQEVADLAALSAGDRLFDVDLYAVRERVLSQPMVRNASVVRQLPASIRIEISERVPLAFISASEMYAVDREGMLLPQHLATSQFDVPLINGIPGLEGGRLGTILGQKEVREALGILSLAEEHGLYHVISELNMEGGKDIVVYSIDGAEFKFGRGDYMRKMVMLETFWKEFAKSEDPKRLATVDLRFDGQVVVKWNTPGGGRPAQASM